MRINNVCKELQIGLQKAIDILNAQEASLQLLGDAGPSTKLTEAQHEALLRHFKSVKCLKEEIQEAEAQMRKTESQLAEYKSQRQSLEQQLKEVGFLKDEMWKEQLFLIGYCARTLKNEHQNMWRQVFRVAQDLKQPDNSYKLQFHLNKQIFKLSEQGFDTFMHEMEEDLDKCPPTYPHAYEYAVSLETSTLITKASDVMNLKPSMTEAQKAYFFHPLVTEHRLSLHFSAYAAQYMKSEANTASHILRHLVKNGCRLREYPVMQQVLEKELHKKLEDDWLWLQTTVNSRLKELSQKIAVTNSLLVSLQDSIKHFKEMMSSAKYAESEADPIRWFFGLHPEEDMNLVVQKIANVACTRYTLPELTGLFKGEDFLTYWQDANNVSHNNLCIAGMQDAEGWDEEKRDATLNDLLLRILLAFPIGQVKVSVLDVQLRGFYSQLVNRMDASLVENIINMSSANTLLQQLEEQIEYVSSVTANVLQYNVQEQQLLVPYHLVVICGCHKDLFFERGTGERWLRLLEVGYRFGIHFISQDSLCTDERIGAFFTTFQEWIEHPLTNYTHYIKYINDTTRTISTRSLLQSSWQNGSAFSATPQSVDNELVIPFGEYAKGQVAECIFNDSRPQAILIGQTGSGKSYFIHTLLLNAMLRYSSHYLEIYLMDFKLGATEMVHYRDYPHISHLLADGSDRKVVYEVLVGLYKRMEQRGKLIANRGCHNISEYNHQLLANEEPMRRILLIVEECHILFESDTSERYWQEQITNIIERIASEGRSQGVHILLDTQTLAGTQIPQKVINNIANRFLMSCSDTDAERLVEKGTQKVRQLTQGMVYHSQADKVARIYDYAPFASQAREAILFHNRRPANALHFFFSGKLSYPYVPNETMMKQSRSITAQLGKGVTVQQDDLVVRLKNDTGQNILITGVDDQMQAERVLYGCLQSFYDSCHLKGKDVRITLIDNFDEDDDLYPMRAPIFQMLEQECSVNIVTGGRRKTEIARLATAVQQGGTGRVEILAILGKEQMQRVLRDTFETQKPEPTTTPVSVSGKGRGYARFTSDSGLQLINANSLFSAAVSRSAEEKRTVTTSPTQPASLSGSVEAAFIKILNDGPQADIFTIMQAKNPSSVFLEEHAQRSTVKKCFCHLVMLRMPDIEARALLPLDNKTSLEALSDDPDRLRAYYFNDEKCKTELFIPYDYSSYQHT